MADPFGTGAGIVGVIGLSIQIAQVLVQFGMDWKSVPENVKSFMAELGALKTILSETNTNIILNPDFRAAFRNQPSVLLSQLGDTAPLTTDTNKLLENCRRELESLLNELKLRGSGHRLGWERFKGAFLTKDTRDSVESLCRQCQTLNSMLSIDAAVLGVTTYKEVKEARKEQQEWHEDGEKISMAIRGGVDESNKRQENQVQQQEKQAILDWLTPVDYTPQQNDFISRRQTGTGQWLLDSTEFQLWLTTEKQTLFCPGIPGSGKTILTSIVIDELNSHFHNKNAGIAYLYCNYRRQDEQKIEDLFASILKQLSQAFDPLPVCLKNLYNRHKTKRTRPTLDEISQALQSITSSFTRVFMIIDALDECLVTGSHRSDFLSEIFDIQKKNGANIFATSRHLPEITEIFQGCISLEIRALESDVRKYVDGHISNLPSFVRRNPDLQEEVKTGIVGTVDGMFLLAQLHLDSLIGKRSPKAVRTALKSLPSGSDAYDNAYKDAMIRIEGQLLDQKDLARQVLSWITCAKRPLTMSELQHALAIELGESSFDEDNLPQIEDMVSVCAGLVTVDEESEIIRLVHYTTQEYFERTKETWFPNLETEIAKICVTCLLFDTFEGGICQDDQAYEERLRLNPFYNYASCNWGHHAREAFTSIPEVQVFLSRNAHVQASIQALLVRKKHYLGESQYSQVFPRQMTGLHLAAYFGVEKTVQHLLGIDIHSDQLPLSRSVENGHERVVLKRVVEVDIKDGSGRTPLSWAAENGHELLVKWLLANNADVNLKNTDFFGQAPLSLAAANGQEAMVNLLLVNGAEVDLKCTRYGWTPLAYAANNGHNAVIKLLLMNNADIESRSSSNQTPLSHAVGHEVVFKLLLEKGAKIDTKDENNRTPLSHAASGGNGVVVKLLLDAGADVYLKDKDGRTPLSWAAVFGYKAIAQLLLSNNSEVEVKDFRGQTPLSLAAMYGHEPIVKLLLVSNAEVDSEDNNGRTPLSWAADCGYQAIVKLLLAYNAEVNSEDSHGRTPLLYAARDGHEAIFELLLERNAKISLRDKVHNQTSLSWAATKEDEALVNLLQGHKKEQCVCS